MAALAHFDHHQGGICKHVQLFKQKSELYKFNTVSLTAICTRCSKAMDMRFVLIIISRQVALPTKCFIIANHHLCLKVMGCFAKSVRILVIYSICLLLDNLYMQNPAIRPYKITNLILVHFFPKNWGGRRHFIFIFYSLLILA